MSDDTTLVVLAAGLGRRFGEPKQLKPLGPGDNVLLEYTAYDAIRAGFRNIVFIIQTPFTDDFASLVSSLPNDVTVKFAFQDQSWPEGVSQPERTKPWGTGHALLTAQHLIDGPFVLCNADDYYGASAFERAAEFFDGKDPESMHYGMLGYRLDATLSDNGSVSRALCAVSENGYLTSISEHSKIKRKDSVIFSEIRQGEEIELNAADQVSMNFWMLTQSIFRFLESGVRTFIERHRHDPSAECRLPDIIQSLIQQSEVIVECLPHNDAWFGLTHSSDYEIAVSAIQAMHDDGTYPTPLWKDDA
jgi:NDP-sugar pyrophosphorylase family protein